MNDIAKCNWTDCPLKEDCQRDIIKADKYQCWMKGQVKDWKCEYQLIKK